MKVDDLRRTHANHQRPDAALAARERPGARRAADAAKLMTGREVTAAAITAALASEPGE